MNRSRLLAGLRSLVHRSGVARKRGSSLGELIYFEQRRRSRNPGRSRREFLKYSGLTAGAVLSTGRLASASRQPRIAIIGAGMAGLNAALTLQDAGFAATIYEASRNVGGRVHSNTGSWLQNQTSEWCGEFIDSGHTTMLSLAQRFGLTVVDEIMDQPSGSTDTLYFFEQYYSVEKAFKDFQKIADRVEADANDLFPTTFDPATQSRRAVQLDHMSAHQWIDRYVPGGHRSPLGAYINSAFTNEFGLDTDLQSSLNLVYSLGFQPDSDSFAIYGESDQRFHIEGGNDQLPFRMAAELRTDRIRTRWWMESIRKSGDGTFGITFASPEGVRYVTADHVILTLPFSVLRNLDYGHAGFDPLKRTAIEELGYGTNSKLIVQCTERLWNIQGPWGLGDGNMYTDLFFQNTWDASRGTPAQAGLLVAFLGGREALALGGAAQPFADVATSPHVARYVEEFLKPANRPWPSIKALWSGRATLSTPWKAPNLLGSYSCWKVGQYTKFSGYEGVRQGNCHFAGEHCSQSFQGFMEGAAQEGARAAQEIIDDLS
jgi:monoamine oxidase